MQKGVREVVPKEGSPKVPAIELTFQSVHSMFRMVGSRGTGDTLTTIHFLDPFLFARLNVVFDQLFRLPHGRPELMKM